MKYSYLTFIFLCCTWVITGCALDTHGTEGAGSICYAPDQVHASADPFKRKNRYALKGRCRQNLPPSLASNVFPEYEVHLTWNCKSMEAAESMELSNFWWSAGTSGVGWVPGPQLFREFRSFAYNTILTCDGDPWLHRRNCSIRAEQDSLEPNLEPWHTGLIRFMNRYGKPLSVSIVETGLRQRLHQALLNNLPKPIITLPHPNALFTMSPILFQARARAPCGIEGTVHEIDLFFEAYEAVAIPDIGWSRLEWVQKQRITVSAHNGWILKRHPLPSAKWRVWALYRMTTPGGVMSQRGDPVEFEVKL